MSTTVTGPWACSWLPTLTSATSTTWHDTKEAADRAEKGLRNSGSANVVVWFCGETNEGAA